MVSSAVLNRRSKICWDVPVRIELFLWELEVWILTIASYHRFLWMHSGALLRCRWVVSSGACAIWDFWSSLRMDHKHDVQKDSLPSETGSPVLWFRDVRSTEDTHTFLWPIKTSFLYIFIIGNWFCILYFHSFWCERSLLHKAPSSLSLRYILRSLLYILFTSPISTVCIM